MANNLLVSYDLIGSNRDYGPVTTAVQALGAWGKIEYSFFYVSSSLSAVAAATRVWQSMHANDKLIVVDASNNNFSGYNITPEVLAHMQAQWSK